VAGPLSRLWWLRQKISLLGRGGDRDGGRGRGRDRKQGWVGRACFFGLKKSCQSFR